MSEEETKTIVIAWVEKDFEVVRERRRDLGELPDLREVSVPKAAVWVLQGTAEDEQKARTYAAAQKDRQAFVFVYPKVWQSGQKVEEPDPLGRAKAAVLKVGA